MEHLTLSDNANLQLMENNMNAMSMKVQYAQRLHLQLQDCSLQPNLVKIQGLPNQDLLEVQAVAE